MSDNEADIITIPVRLKSLNQTLREHWAVRKRTKQEYALLIRNQMRRKKISFAEQKKYKLLILSYRKKKLDVDNLYGGSCKSLIDALIGEQFIFDDNPDYIDLVVEQHIAKEYQTIIIRKNI